MERVEIDEKRTGGKRGEEEPFAGWLIALMVWLLPAAEAAKTWIIIVITYLIGVAKFPHIIAGAVEASYLGLSGLRTWGDLIGTFVLPTLIGNTIGGVALVAALAYAQIAGDKEQNAESDAGAR